MTGRVDTDRLPEDWRPVWQPARPAITLRMPAPSPAMIEESRVPTEPMPYHRVLEMVT